MLDGLWHKGNQTFSVGPFRSISKAFRAPLKSVHVQLFNEQCSCWLTLCLCYIPRYRDNWQAWNVFWCLTHETTGEIGCWWSICSEVSITTVSDMDCPPSLVNHSWQGAHDANKTQKNWQLWKTGILDKNCLLICCHQGNYKKGNFGDNSVKAAFLETG